MFTVRMKSSKRFLRPYEWLLLLAAVLLVLYILRPEGKFSVFERSETVTILDKPSNSRQLPKARSNVYDSDREREAGIDKSLDALARQYANSRQPDRSSGGSLTEGESRYLEQVGERNKLNEQIEGAKSWYRLLKASHETYTTLRSLISQASGKAEAELENKALNDLFANAHTASDIYEQLNRLFGIAPARSSEFAASGRKTLADWAEFIEKSQKQ